MKRPLLIYCAYPIIDRENEPNWVSLVDQAIITKTLENILVYRPFYAIEAQENIHEFLNKKDDTNLLYSIFEILKLETKWIPYDLKEALTMENHGSYALKLITKELWLLSKADLVVVDCDLSDKGDRDMILLIARLLNLPIIGVSNKFITGPWLSALTGYTTNDNNLTKLISILAEGIWKAESEAVKPVGEDTHVENLVEEENKHD